MGATQATVDAKSGGMSPSRSGFLQKNPVADLHIGVSQWTDHRFPWSCRASIVASMRSFSVQRPVDRTLGRPQAISLIDIHVGATPEIAQKALPCGSFGQLWSTYPEDLVCSGELSTPAARIAQAEAPVMCVGMAFGRIQSIGANSTDIARELGRCPSRAPG